MAALTDLDTWYNRMPIPREVQARSVQLLVLLLKQYCASGTLIRARAGMCIATYQKLRAESTLCRSAIFIFPQHQLGAWSTLADDGGLTKRVGGLNPAREQQVRCSIKMSDKYCGQA